jgi:hypothetical protein
MKPQENMPKPAMPENFRAIVRDFVADLSVTFSEYSFLWEKWSKPETTDVDFQHLFEYCLAKYPERFFDILYQNDDLFSAGQDQTSSDSPVYFLPDVDFRLLYNSEGVGEVSKKAIWKYLQLILMSVIGAVKDKANFGDAANLFGGLEEADLHEKLTEVMGGIGEFFKGMMEEADAGAAGAAGAAQGDGVDQEPSHKPSFTFDQMPNVEELHGHLKGLFDGKIGTLAKELAAEIGQDLSSMLGDDAEGPKTTKDVFQMLLKNPTKLTGIMKTVGSKLDQKMKSGEISHDDIMKEASEIMSRMKEMGGGQEQFSKMFQDMAKNMGLPKGAKLDMNALNHMISKHETKEKLKSKLGQRKEKKAEEARLLAIEIKKKQEEYARLMAAAGCKMEQVGENEMVFRTEEGTAERSGLKPNPDLLLTPFPELLEPTKKHGPKNGGGKKKKKSKK